ncbi:MAG: glycosyltransferase family 4 protein [Devosia sp.]|nr:glycosyltransferase family 4 protein [Devosia sp.]
MTEKPLRILQIMRSPIGGLFRHVLDLTRELAARGHVIGVVVDSEKSDAATESKLGDLAKYVTLGIHRPPIPRTLGAADLTTPLKIRALAKRLDIDILHGHGAKGGFNARLARIGNRKAAALYTPHGGVLHFDPRSGAGRIFRQLEKLLLGQTNAIIFESQFAHDAFARQIVVPTCVAPVIHNGLLPGEFEPVSPGPDARDFVFIGELRTLKGVGVLLEALEPMRAPDGRLATLIMAGDGPDRAAFEAQIKAAGLADRVTLAGVQPARKMFGLGRVVVVPSLAESLPYVVLEAAAAGLPVIASRVGGIPEIFGPTAESLVPAGDPVALRALMQAALDTPEVARAEAAQRLNFIRDRFSVGTMTDQIEALYRRVVTRP